MKKILISLLIICILISIDSYVYASYLSYEAEEYIMKINNINENIEKIGIRIKNENEEYKTFISNDNSMWMSRYGGNPIIDKEKITIFDYQTAEYESNSEYSFKVPKQLQTLRTSKSQKATMLLLF